MKPVLSENQKCMDGVFTALWAVCSFFFVCTPKAKGLLRATHWRPSGAKTSIAKRELCSLRRKLTLQLNFLFNLFMLPQSNCAREVPVFALSLITRF